MEKKGEKGEAKNPVGVSTEEQILRAAKEVFHKKGFSGARTRDIAETAGLNLALLNYYFRSKKKLFDIIMLDTLKEFLGTLESVLNEPETTLFQKIENLVNRYIDFFLANPDIPLFMLSELRAHPEALIKNVGIKNVFRRSFFLSQIKEALKNGEINPINPLHLMMNLVGMVIFPFAGSPIFMAIGDLNPKAYGQLMEERRKIIPAWMAAALKPGAQAKPGRSQK